MGCGQRLHEKWPDLLHCNSQSVCWHLIPQFKKKIKKTFPCAATDGGPEGKSESLLPESEVLIISLAAGVG